jgi:beta-lactamase regulating signal transducer with metallopeptidase domain
MDALLNWLWQGGVVASALFVMLMLLARTRANVRYVVCWAAALFVIALPLLPALQPTSFTDAIDVSENDAIVALPDVWWTSTRVIVGAAILWAGVNIIRLSSAFAAIRGARRRSRTFPAHLESRLPHWRRVRDVGRRATLVLSDEVTSAAVLGLGAPMIAVAPSVVRTLDPEDLDRVLLHEWTHVQRRDDIINLGHILIRLVSGWHPALWWIDRRLRVEREIACDETVIAVTGRPKSYAECLMKLSALEGTPRATDAAPAVFTQSGLRARIVKIVSPHQPIAPIWSGSLAAAIVVVLCLLSVAVGAVTLVEATTFAEPLLSSATLTRTVRLVAGRTSEDRGHDRAKAASSVTTQPMARPGAIAAPASQRPAPPQPVSRPRATTPPAGEDSQESNATPPVTPIPATTVALGATTVPLALPTTPAATAESSRSPWSAAADGGVTLGRKSKDAGVATAGFFTRLARRVAGSL